MRARAPGRLPFLALAALVLTAKAARAGETPRLRDASSVRAEGMGGAARGFASSDEALLVNPAGIAATTRFNLAAGGLFDLSGRFRTLSVAAVDSQLNAEDSVPISGALGYSWYRSGED